MGPIMLDVNNYGSLYDAWNGQSLENIEDFNYKEVAESFFVDNTPGGNETEANQTKCLKETWIKELPKILLFTINRVNYDVRLRKLVKNNKRFDFEKIVYPDKFLYSNIKKDSEINEKI